MYVHRQIGDFADALDDRLAQRQVRDEMMVHHIDMNQICIGDGLEVTLKIAEVGGRMLGAISMLIITYLTVD